MNEKQVTSTRVWEGRDEGAVGGQGRAKPFSRGGGEKIKEQHVPGRGTFLARGACEIISRAKRAKNFSPPSRVFRPPLGPKCS